MNTTNWTLEHAVQIQLPDDDAFLKIKETLQRIGIASYSTKSLYQSCHILHKRGLYYILHFKCLFALDGKPAPFDEADWKRQNAIAKLLSDWGLCKIVSNLGPVEDMKNIKIIKHGDRQNWQLISKYNIGE